MFRQAITMLVAFAVTLFTLNPSIDAQSGWPTVSQSDPATYPAVSQNGDQPPPPGAGTDPNAGPEPSSNPQQDAAADQQHGIARLSIVQGDVNLKRGDDGQFTAATINAPLSAQDQVQTSGGSRAEVELDAANLVRLAPNTELGFATLEYGRYQLQLGAGTIIYRVLRNSTAQVEVDTPSIGFRPLSQGEFRLSIFPDGTTQITARSGQGEIFGPRGSQQLPNGQSVLVRGNASDPEFRNTSEAPRDQFDDWSAERDSELLQSQSYRYVNPNIPGADDLDQYGNWVPSQYGQVWAPQSQPADWSPYSTGEWAWQDYYGWTWVDSAPWGWAPYHYGRWFHNGGYGWCWWPGAYTASAFWSPALVGFFGLGGLGLGLALGGLGWIALAPFEGFHRWWGPGWYGRGWGGYGYGGRGFVRPYGNNFVRNGDIARVYRNAAFRGAAHTAALNGFGGPQQRFAVASRAQLSGASSFMGGRMPVGPTRASYQFSSRQVVPNARLTSAAGQRFFQSSQFRSQQIRPVQGGLGAVQNSASRVGAARAPYPSARTSSSGWQRFGDPGNGGALRQGFRGGSDPGGWHTFGQPQPSASPKYTAPRYNGNQYNAPRYSTAPQYSAPRYSAPNYNTPRNTAPSYTAPRYNAPSYNSAPRYNTPQQHYSAPQQHYSAPQQHYSAPQQRNSPPHYSAPSHSSGGGGGFHGGSSGGGGGHGGGGHHR